ncbi:MAG: hypothetical protein H0T76_11630 [Nannocystis sp.]|nr:hypothetical protein [Nannocystis sp.]MBA3547126.1 hypothetical protein [Nannocystis sp.]
MRFAPPLVALALVDLLGGCAKQSHCPVVELPPPAVTLPVEPEPVEPEPVEPGEEAPPTRRDHALAFVKLGYGDEPGGGFHSLNFRTEALNTDVAQEAVMLVEQYNAFAGVKVAEALEQLRGDIMYYEFGREHSPVLYVHLPYWTSQQERSCPANHCREGAWGDADDSRKLEPREHAALLQRARTAFGAADADTIDPVMENDHVLRIWWD